MFTWGEPEFWTVSARKEETVSCNIRFCGQYEDEESGLFYNRFRYYSPETGQYLSPDPLGLAGGVNPYGYVSNPVSFVDPFGLSKCPSIVESARARQARMLEDDVGYNISPKSWDQYPSIGRDGTFITDKKGALKYFERVQSGETTISKSTVARIERDMGLNLGSLKDGFNIRKIEGITNMQPRSPLSGNDYFLGPGQHLPGGAPEMVINSVPTSTPVMLRVNVL
ncbi:type IV secretion protein Rhs [Photorhabdus khanii subsp. guanajuatensis]|uniref:Type IV secretion protein Rhs n=1 Tax=Photorhabdus khanii subsp. guanajuatensis TaxID=2100166 RepID=A0A4V2X488_9GAMM|nr:type IV secretion protein Rhs [Photorhabdus khanii subsp. guanajuatensis]